MVLQAPCLLPQLSSLQKIELKDTRYWEIVFEKNYNWQQLEDMLKRSDSLSVKQRAGCLSYIEDPHGFRSLIAQTLTTEKAFAWTIRPEYITSFTNDKTVLNIVKYFMQVFKKEKRNYEGNMKVILHGNTNKAKHDYFSKNLSNITSTISNNWNEQSEHSQGMEITEMSSSLKDINYVPETEETCYGITEFEQNFLQTFAVIVYECVIKDKVGLLPSWVSMVKNMEILEKQPNSFSIWQIKLLSSQMLHKLSLKESNPLLSAETILAIKQKVSLTLDGWENELIPVIKHYLTTGIIECDLKTLSKMSTYFIFYDVPYYTDNKIFLRPFQQEEMMSTISSVTLYKLYKIFKTN